jgi:hypothetical protein
MGFWAFDSRERQVSVQLQGVYRTKGGSITAKHTVAEGVTGVAAPSYCKGPILLRCRRSGATGAGAAVVGVVMIFSRGDREMQRIVVPKSGPICGLQRREEGGYLLGHS